MELNRYSVHEVANTLDEMVLNEPDELRRSVKRIDAREDNKLKGATAAVRGEIVPQP
jgi:hypothetical protein